MSSLLVELAWPHPADANEVLTAFFDDGALVGELAALAPRLHHVGVIAPAGLDTPAVAGLLRASAFRHDLRHFRSAILAKDLSTRLGRHVEVQVVEGRATPAATRYPAVEVFVADLSASELDDLVERETGCHVALAVASHHCLERARHVLHTHDRWELPLMRNGALENREIRSSILYVDSLAPSRRLELIAPVT